MAKDIDEFGLVSWGTRRDYREDGTGVLVEDSPYTDMRDFLKTSSVPKYELDAVQDLRDELYCARSIALTVFGAHWSEHVVEVHDRLIAKFKEYALMDGRPKRPYLPNEPDLAEVLDS